MQTDFGEIIPIFEILGGLPENLRERLDSGPGFEKIKFVDGVMHFEKPDGRKISVAKTTASYDIKIRIN
jgi:hypothetical protein